MDKKIIIELIADIIHDIEPKGMEEAYIAWEDADKAANKIMEIIEENGYTTNSR